MQIMCGTLSAPAKDTLAALASPASNPPYNGEGKQQSSHECMQCPILTSCDVLLLSDVFQ